MLLGHIKFTIQTLRHVFTRDVTFLRETHKVRIAEVPTSNEAKEKQVPTPKQNITQDSDEKVLDLGENLEAPPLTLNNSSDEESEGEEEDSENRVTVGDTNGKGLRLEDTAWNKQLVRALKQIGEVSYNLEADRQDPTLDLEGLRIPENGDKANYEKFNDTIYKK